MLHTECNLLPPNQHSQVLSTRVILSGNTVSLDSNIGSLYLLQKTLDL
jgi:hypothetical protein